MAAAAVTYEVVKKQIASGRLAPVYILHGKEGYYIDELVKAFETMLPEADREFNQYVLYAPQVEIGAVMDLCYRFPMMADRQLVILKEAQAVRADQINRMHKYLLNPSKSTVLVIVFRGDQAKGKDLMAAAKTGAVVFESKEVKDYQLAPVIAGYIKDKGMTADPKSVEMLREFIGANLSQMFNEIDKLATILGRGAAITPEAIERNIGISKDYNVFELIDAIAVKDVGKAMRIAKYFSDNPKAHPLVMATPSIYNFFSDLLILHFTVDKSDAGMMNALALKSAYPLKRFKAAMRMYNYAQTIEAVWALRRFDCQSKGNGSRQNEHQLFRDYLFHIFTAQGNCGI